MAGISGADEYTDEYWAGLTDELGMITITVGPMIRARAQVLSEAEKAARAKAEKEA